MPWASRIRESALPQNGGRRLSIVPYAILSVLTQLGVITPEEACSLPRYHDKNLTTTTTTPSWAAPELAFQLEQLC